MDIKPEIAVGLDPLDQPGSRRLTALARRLGLPTTAAVSREFDFLLVIRGSRLELIDSGEAAASPVCVDFLSGPSRYRFLRDRRIDQPLARAVGIKRGVRPTLLDATAGFGEDGFVLASLGCTVTMTERSPVVWALLADGIARARVDDGLRLIFDRQVHLRQADSIDYLSTCELRFDTIYLDPMYPPSPRSPLNKRKMRVLRALVGEDLDADRLLGAALAHGSRRVVVKRPARAQPVGGLTPSLTIGSRSSRYDVYFSP